MASSSFKCADAPGAEPSAARLADGDADPVPALLHRANVSDLLRAGWRVLGPAGPSYGLRHAARGGVVAVRNSRHEAARATELLTTACGFPVHVEGLIVTVNADDVVVKNQPDGVSVVPRMQVTKWLLRHGEVLTTDAIDAIHEAARRSTTWRP